MFQLITLITRILDMLAEMSNIIQYIFADLFVLAMLQTIQSPVNLFCEKKYFLGELLKSWAFY